MPSTSGRAASHPRRVDKLKFFHELKQLRDNLKAKQEKLGGTASTMVGDGTTTCQGPASSLVATEPIASQSADFLSPPLVRTTSAPGLTPSSSPSSSSASCPPPPPPPVSSTIVLAASDSNLGIY